MKYDVVTAEVADIAPNLNTLCFQILGVLLRQPRSGYEIVKQLEYVRPVKTSQVYPTLARLENYGFVVSDDVVQDGRPNKRVYSVTAAGESTVKDWIGTDPAPPIWRETRLINSACVWPATGRSIPTTSTIPATGLFTVIS